MQTITSRENIVIKQVQKLLKSSKQRKEENKFVIEGVRLCFDALESGAVISKVLFSNLFVDKNKELINKLQEVCENTFIISDKLFSQVSDTKTPQGVLCVCDIIEKDFNFLLNNKYLFLENMQDPANMGTVLRTAEALGLKGVALSQDCCDIYSPKVLRGSMGAVFRVPILRVSDPSALASHLNGLGFTTLATVLDDSALNIIELTDNEKSSAVIFIGNEGNGLKEKTINACKKSITIPMNGNAESLNACVAASIAMWEILR